MAQEEMNYGEQKTVLRQHSILEETVTQENQHSKSFFLVPDSIYWPLEQMENE